MAAGKGWLGETGTGFRVTECDWVPRSDPWFRRTARDLSGLLFPGRAFLAADFHVVLGSVDRASAVEKR